jgi:hypothetical protein
MVIVNDEETKIKITLNGLDIDAVLEVDEHHVILQFKTATEDENIMVITKDDLLLNEESVS